MKIAKSMKSAGEGGQGEEEGEEEAEEEKEGTGEGRRGKEEKTKDS